MKELIRTDHKILNKVVSIFSSLCFEIAEHKQRVREREGGGKGGVERERGMENERRGRKGWRESGVEPCFSNL